MTYQRYDRAQLLPLHSTRLLVKRDRPRGEYDDAALALFAAYREQRQRHAPQPCDGGAICWVRDGPPAITQNGQCRGCGGTPRFAR